MVTIIINILFLILEWPSFVSWTTVFLQSHGILIKESHCVNCKLLGQKVNGDGKDASYFWFPKIKIGF